VKFFRTFRLGTTLVSLAALLFPGLAAAQTSSPSSTDSAVRELQGQVRELRSLVEQMRSENVQSRAEMERLRQDLQTTRTLLEQRSETATAAPLTTSSNANAAPTSQTPAQSSLEERVEKLEDSSELMSAKIDEQHQTKVETASKYRARLHGIILMNAFRNVGGSNNLDLPDYSEPLPGFFPTANVGATLRQSQIGLEVFGPTVFGAKTSGDIQFDFAGGFPNTGNGVNFGILRLETASLRLDWEHTSVVAGQDNLFFSPLSPTSFASVATPAFGFAGNLWGWTPQLRIEHRFEISDQQSINVQAGVLDNLDWEYPYNSYYRSPHAGELSGQPAYALRTSWSRPVWEHPLSFGVAGYYGRQNWLWGRFTDAWAGMADWQIPLLPRLGLSGEFYRGRGVGGLGGGIGTSILYGGDSRYAFTPIRGLDSIGGWTQLKLQLTPKLELNGAVAQDNPFANDVRGFATDQNNFGPILGRNRGALGNVVFRPRSDLVLSAELRRYRTFPIYSSSSTMNQVNLSMGILF